MIRRWRLGIEHIDAAPAKCLQLAPYAAPFIDNSAARGVDEKAVFSCRCNRAAPNIPIVSAERAVNGHEIRPRERGIETETGSTGRRMFSAGR